MDKLIPVENLYKNEESSITPTQSISYSQGSLSEFADGPISSESL